MDLKSPQFWRKINSIDLPLVVTVISATGSRYVLPKMTEHAQSFTCKGSTWTLPRGPAASAIKKHSLSTGPLPPKESTNCPLDVSCRSITWTVLFRSQRVEVDSFPVGYGSMNVVDIFLKLVWLCYTSAKWPSRSWNKSVNDELHLGPTDQYREQGLHRPPVGVLDYCGYSVHLFTNSSFFQPPC